MSNQLGMPPDGLSRGGGACAAVPWPGLGAPCPGCGCGANSSNKLPPWAPSLWTRRWVSGHSAQGCARAWAPMLTKLARSQANAQRTARSSRRPSRGRRQPSWSTSHHAAAGAWQQRASTAREHGVSETLGHQPQARAWEERGAPRAHRPPQEAVVLPRRGVDGAALADSASAASQVLRWRRARAVRQTVRVPNVARRSPQRATHQAVLWQHAAENAVRPQLQRILAGRPRGGRHGRGVKTP